MDSSRRRFLGAGLTAVGGVGLLAARPWTAANAASPAAPTWPPVRGGTAILGIPSEPAQLASALTSAGPTQAVSGKIFDGLIFYDLESRPQPQLATAWQVSEDGLRITFRLRPGVRWHDGRPFTSEDVAFSVLEVWKKYHSRGRATFANVIQVETPDPLIAVFVLSKPAPYILNALASTESQPVPKHLYQGSDPLSNPRNLTPIGTGPFRFVSWQRGSHIVLERNPDYWDTPRPYLDRLIIRFLPESSAIAAALETEAILAGTPTSIDIVRLAQRPNLITVARDTSFNPSVLSFEFNLDRPAFRDPRVRQAFAHAIDRDFLAKNIFLGFGTVVDSPIPASMAAFHATGLPFYELDLVKAEALLEAAGLQRGAGGVRLTCFADSSISGPLHQIAQVLRSSLAKIGVQLKVRLQDPGEFVNRIYTRRDFDTMVYGASAGPDPAIGMQRFYWSKDFAPGVAFSNGAHYVNPEVDSLLEAAQTELDPNKRHALYDRFQTIVQTDAVTLPLIGFGIPLVINRRFHDVITTADGYLGNFAHANLPA
jgi:peptide/nickel transport system substrate-binding protein